MEAYLRKYLWLSTPLVVAICALFAARAVGQLVIAAVPQPKVRRASGLARSAAQYGSPVAARDLSQVAKRNVFCAKCEPISLAHVAEPAAGDGDAAAEPGNGEPVKSSLPLRLLATMVSDEDRASCYAALYDPTEQKVAMVAIGSRAADSVIVTDIMVHRVLLDNAGRAEFIDLEAEEKAGAPAEPVRSPRAEPKPRRNDALSKLNEEVSNGVRQLGPNKWEIQRSALNKVLTNTTLLARSARIVPSLQNGKPDGFKLYAIRPGSIYSLIGMQNGDTINAINGREMTTPDKALEVYTKVRNASHLTISFTRRGATKTHDYTIR